MVVLQEQAVFVERREPAEQPLQRRQPALERLEIHHEPTQRDGPRQRPCRHEGVGAEHQRRRHHLTDQVGGESAGAEAQPFAAQGGADVAVAGAEQPAQAEQANFSGVAAVREEKVVVPGAPFGVGVIAGPAEEAPRKANPHQRARRRREQQDDRHPPLERCQKCRDREHRGAVLEDLVEPADHAGGPVGGLFLGAVERVVASRVLEELDVDLARLLVDFVRNRIGHDPPLDLAHGGSRRRGDADEHRDCAGGDDVDQDLAPRQRVVGRCHPGGDGVNDPLGQDEQRNRQQPLHHDQRVAGQRPARRGAPDQGQGGKTSRQKARTPAGDIPYRCTFLRFAYLWLRTLNLNGSTGIEISLTTRAMPVLSTGADAQPETKLVKTPTPHCTPLNTSRTALETRTESAPQQSSVLKAQVLIAYPADSSVVPEVDRDVRGNIRQQGCQGSDVGRRTDHPLSGRVAPHNPRPIISRRTILRDARLGDGTI